MKRQRLRFKLLALFLFGLIALLAVYGGYSVLTNGSRWFASTHNTRLRDEKQRVTAGDILDRDGAVLAMTSGDGTRLYAEDLFTRKAMVHVVGDTSGRVRNAVETFQSAYLYGFQASIWERIGDLLHNTDRKGDTVQLTVSASLSKALADSFSQKLGEDPRGAAVVMNWKTGEVLALVSLPAFDPTVDNGTVPDGAYLNRATEALYAPGTAFSPVTWAASLSQDHSASPAARLRNTSEAFGLNENFLFRDLVVANAVYPTGNPSDSQLALLQQGSGGILVTPMHMCIITASIANDGVMMEPRMLLKVTTSTGKTRLDFSSRIEKICVDPSVSLSLQSRMREAAASLPALQNALYQTPVGAWTGAGENCAWFIGFLQNTNSPYAICVMTENGDENAAASIGANSIAWLLEHPISLP
ncbi:MAG: hypothetical protein IK127_07475 [Clostridia bacterium]|nr:hypothetical protein [Clostridia bacterium]